MASTMHPQARRLLDAHVEYLMAQLQGPALEALVSREIDEMLSEGRRLTLEEAVTRDMIKATARSYAVELDLSGAIPELVGDIARALYAHPVHGRTTLNDLLPDGLFEEFLDKILDMRDLHQWVVHEAVDNPVYTQLATDVVIEALRGYLYHGGARAKRLPGARQMGALGGSLLRSALPALEETLEESLRSYLQRSMQDLLKSSEDFLLGLLDKEQVRSLVLEGWDAIKDRRISEFKEGVSGLDIEEFFVIGYEAWRSLRDTPFYGSLIDSGIDAFFDKYGESSLHEVLEEMGITRDIALNEALRFAPHVLDVLRERGMLEPMVRRHLTGFYASGAVEAILLDTAEPAPHHSSAAKAAGTAHKTPSAPRKADSTKAPSPRKGSKKPSGT
ncbi:MAG TPA: hypothetical protein VFM34_07315 [Moraxellaceae bacterium]|nr:hypothetical protein [Moraxellaceae bacterium]